MLLAVVLAAAVLPGARHAAAAGVVFRYLPGQPSLSSEVVLDGVDTGPLLLSRELGGRGPGGWGLAPPYTAEFSGAGSTLRSASGDDLRQALGPRLTAEAWVRLADVSGRRVLVTNRVGDADGFALGVEEGAPYFVLQAAGRAYAVTAAQAVADAESHWLAATAEHRDGRLYLTLYLDGHRLEEAAFDGAASGGYAIAAPFFVGTEASGDADAPTLTGSITGHLYAALVRDYVADARYLTSSLPHDGGHYLGLPGFHDYALDTFHLPMDQRIGTNPTAVRHRFFMPFVNDGYIPQGTASNVEEDGQGLVYLAYYHRTRSGRTGTRPSIVAEIDAETGHVRRAFRLTGRLGYSHAGGIAHTHGALFVASAGVLERYPIPPYEGPDGPKYVDLVPDEAGTVAVESKASFVSAFQDTLWVGDWRPAGDVAPYLYAIPLDAAGRPDVSARAAAFALPRNVQGVDLFAHDGETYVFMSRNRNYEEAEVLRFRRAQLDRYVIPEPEATVVLPSGIEDLSFFPDGTLWTSSETGTDYYQRRDDPWGLFYPFVYGLHAHTVLPGVSPTGTEAPPDGAAGFALTAYPNPASGDVTVTFIPGGATPARVVVVDVLGRRVATLAARVTGRGTHSAHWDAASAAPGLYFVVVEAGGGRSARPITLVR